MGLEHWHAAASTAVGLFWTALWAFCLGYLVSGMIQVFVSRERMRRTMGDDGPKSVALGAAFGFLSSSCSFAALSTTRALFAKGASLVASLSFLLASTNLVIELGIVIAVFLSWQFVVGEYVGGLLLILITWALLRLRRPAALLERAREVARSHGDDEAADSTDWRALIRSRDGWRRVAKQYVMEWSMVWKDVTVGFTVAGLIATFVPREFFQTLFVGSGADDPAFWQVAAQTLIGPAAAFVTFIGSMGNVPLAAVLFANGVSFAGIMAFLFSDLVVFPVLRIQAESYGWRMALFITTLFLVALSVSALTLHYGFAWLDLLPSEGAVKTITEREFFELDLTLLLNLVFLALSALLAAWHGRATLSMFGPGKSWGDRLLFALALLGIGWLAGGLALPLFTELPGA